MQMNVPVRTTPSLIIIIIVRKYIHNSVVLNLSMKFYLHMTTVCWEEDLIWAIVSCSMRDKMDVGCGNPCCGQLSSCSIVTMSVLGGFGWYVVPSVIVTSSFLTTMSL